MANSMPFEYLSQKEFFGPRINTNQKNDVNGFVLNSCQFATLSGPISFFNFLFGYWLVPLNLVGNQRQKCYVYGMEEQKTEQVIKIKQQTKGVVNPRLVRNIAFVVITLSLVVCTVLCILAIWKFTDSDAVWRAIATFIVVSVATGVFTFVNERLG